MGKGENKTPAQLAVEATRRALDNAKLSKDEIDGLFTSRPPQGDHRAQMNVVLAQTMKIAPKFSSELTIHGAGIVSALGYASLLVSAGLAENILIVNAEAALDPMGDRRTGNALMETNVWFDVPYRPFTPALYALIANRYIHEYGVKPEQAAVLPVQNRKWAVRHPYASMKDKGEITVDDVVNSRTIVSPFHLLDCAVFGRPVGRGGAIVVTSMERATKLTDRPVYILGFGERAVHDNLTDRLGESNSPPKELWSTITTSGGAFASRDAYRMAGIKSDDIDVAHVSDQFSYIGMINLEDAGFCPKGKAAKYLEEGNIDFGSGRLALNTNGGFLSFGQTGAGGCTDFIIETARQLRGDAPGQQVKDARYGLILGHGGVMSCSSCCILGNDSAGGAS